MSLSYPPLVLLLSISCPLPVLLVLAVVLLSSGWPVSSWCFRCCYCCPLLVQPCAPFLSSWCPPPVPQAVPVVIVQSRLCLFCWPRRLVPICVSCLAGPCCLSVLLVHVFGPFDHSLVWALSTAWPCHLFFVQLQVSGQKGGLRTQH